MRLRAVVVLSLVIVMVAAPARAAQDASDPPTATGPMVNLDGGSCFADEWPDGARTEECSWWFDLLPAETNATEDYAAYWFQIEVAPPKGACTKEVLFGLDVPDRSRLASAAPARSSRIRRPQPVVTQLEVDAEGAALLAGAVENEFTAAPGRVHVGIGDTGYGYRWTGSWPDDMVVSIGLQIAGDTLPSELISEWFGMQGFVTGPCAGARSGR